MIKGHILVNLSCLQVVLYLPTSTLTRKPRFRGITTGLWLCGCTIDYNKYCFIYDFFCSNFNFTLSHRYLCNRKLLSLSKLPVVCEFPIAHMTRLIIFILCSLKSMHQNQGSAYNQLAVRNCLTCAINCLLKFCFFLTNQK